MTISGKISHRKRQWSPFEEIYLYGALLNPECVPCYCKVGVSANVKKRFRAFAITNPDVLPVLIFKGTKDKVLKVERLLKQHLDRFGVHKGEVVITKDYVQFFTWMKGWVRDVLELKLCDLPKQD